VVAGRLLQSHLQGAAPGYRVTSNPNIPVGVRPNMTRNPNTVRWGSVAAGGLLQSICKGQQRQGWEEEQEEEWRLPEENFIS